MYKHPHADALNMHLFKLVTRARPLLLHAALWFIYVCRSRAQDDAGKCYTQPAHVQPLWHRFAKSRERPCARSCRCFGKCAKVLQFIRVDRICLAFCRGRYGAWHLRAGSPGSTKWTTKVKVALCLRDIHKKTPFVWRLTQLRLASDRYGNNNQNEIKVAWIEISSGQFTQFRTAINHSSHTLTHIKRGWFINHSVALGTLTLISAANKQTINCLRAQSNLWRRCVCEPERHVHLCALLRSSIQRRFECMNEMKFRWRRRWREAKLNM